MSFLSRLRYLNLKNNPRLKWRSILSRLSNLTSLETINMSVSEPPGHECAPTNRKYRNVVLKELLLNNPDLSFVDEVTTLAFAFVTLNNVGYYFISGNPLVVEAITIPFSNNRSWSALLKEWKHTNLLKELNQRKLRPTDSCLLST